MSFSALPNVFGGFAPFPNTIATALLAYQSEAIGFGFGIKFQYSKRLLGAMTNEKFNGLTPITIGNIVEAHNTELINRMKAEMPKWLDIQRDFIEASVSVEIAKANRTPSAFREIFEAFTEGFAQQQLGDINNILNFFTDSDSINSITAVSPMLGLMALLQGKGGTGGTTAPQPTGTVFTFQIVFKHWQVVFVIDHYEAIQDDTTSSINRTISCSGIASEITQLANTIQDLETRNPQQSSPIQIEVGAFRNIKNAQLQSQELRAKQEFFKCNI